MIGNPHATRNRAPFGRALALAALMCCAQITRAQPTFTDATVEAGLDHLHWDGTIPTGLPPEERDLLRMAAGVAAGDFDNDGHPDLYVTRLAAPNLLFHNRGDGTFEEVGQQKGVNLTAYSTGCAWGDIDNDGDLDLYVLTSLPDTRNYLFINHGDDPFAEEAIPRGLALESTSEARRSTSAAYGDYDLDGDLDLLTTEWIHTPSNNRLLRNDGGAFVDVTEAAGLSFNLLFGFAPAFADVTGDGHPDILIAGDFGGSRLCINNQNATFTDVTAASGTGTDENGMGSAIGDIDADGDLDWFVTAIYDKAQVCRNAPCIWGDTGNRLYRNDGPATFTDITDTAHVRNGYWGWAAAFLDYDNDGDLDLAMTNGAVFPGVTFEDAFNEDPNRFWQNDGTGQMTEISHEIGFTDTRSGKGLAVLDYDSDGDLDIFIANNADHPILYRNDGGNDNAWLTVRLKGIHTNRFGIGARITVEPANNRPPVLHETHANSNFMSQSDTAAHFGLGPDPAPVRRITIRWPASDTTTTLENVPPNRTITLEELVIGDCNADGQATPADLACTAACMTGPGEETPAPCHWFDANADHHADLVDFAALTRRITLP